MTDDIVPMTEWVEAFPTDDEFLQSEAYQRWLMEQEAYQLAACEWDN